MAYFKRITSTPPEPTQQNAVIMGRKTWDSIPARFRPLQGRLNVVLSRDPVALRTALPEGVVAAGSMGEALDAIPEGTGRVWVIGGSSLYAVRCGGDEGCAAGPNPPRLQEALASPLCDEIHLTRVYADIQCDVHIPPIDETQFKLAEASERATEAGIDYRFERWARR